VIHWQTGGRAGLREGRLDIDENEDRHPLAVAGRVPERRLEVIANDPVVVAPHQWEEPIRAEVFGIERLEQHAQSLAAAQRTTKRTSKGRNLLPRVQENAQVLLAAYRDIATTIREKSEITPAAEWVLDNFHIVEEQIRGIRDHLPGGYYRRLPKIAEGHLAGYPRVRMYDASWVEWGNDSLTPVVEGGLPE